MVLVHEPAARRLEKTRAKGYTIRTRDACSRANGWAEMCARNPEPAIPDDLRTLEPVSLRERELVPVFVYPEKLI